VQEDSLKKACILVVDDVDLHCATAQGMLTNIGVKHIMFANNGHDALDIIRSRTVDIVLLDYLMPGINGIEVLRIVRTEESIAESLVILTTAANETKVIVQARASDARVDAILIKPYTEGSLHSKLVQLLGRRKLRL